MAMLGSPSKAGSLQRSPTCSSPLVAAPKPSTGCNRRDTPLGSQQRRVQHAPHGGQPCRRLTAARAAASVHSTALGVHRSDEVMGVVIVDAGRRTSESDDLLLDFASCYGQAFRREIVGVANPATLDMAVRGCVMDGANKIMVVPYLLSRGRDVDANLPLALADVQLKYPGVRCAIGESISIENLLAQHIENQVKVVETKVEDVAERTWRHEPTRVAQRQQQQAHACADGSLPQDATHTWTESVRQDSAQREQQAVAAHAAAPAQAAGPVARPASAEPSLAELAQLAAQQVAQQQAQRAQHTAQPLRASATSPAASMARTQARPSEPATSTPSGVKVLDYRQAEAAEVAAAETVMAASVVEPSVVEPTAAYASSSSSSTEAGVALPADSVLLSPADSAEAAPAQSTAAPAAAPVVVPDVVMAHAEGSEAVPVAAPAAAPPPVPAPTAQRIPIAEWAELAMRAAAASVVPLFFFILPQLVANYAELMAGNVAVLAGLPWMGCAAVVTLVGLQAVLTGLKLSGQLEAERGRPRMWGMWVAGSIWGSLFFGWAQLFSASFFLKTMSMPLLGGVMLLLGGSLAAAFYMDANSRGTRSVVA